MGQITSNAVSWVCFRTAGGWKRSLIISGVYFVCVITVLILIFSADRWERGQEIMSGLSRFCLGIQAAVLFGFTCLAISNTMQLDRKSGMVESHRLMPVDSRLVILGYMAGCSTAPLVFALVNFALGLFATAASSLPVSWWIGANLVLLTFCAFAWSIAALGGTLGNFMGLFLLVPLGITLMSGGALGSVMPGLVLLASPVSGKTIWDASSLEAEHLPIFILSAVLQAAMTAIFIHAAARRFRNQDLPAFTGLLGFLLTAMFSVTLLLGVKLGNTVSRQRFNLHGDLAAYVSSSLFVILVFSLHTLSSHVAGDYLERPQRPAFAKAKSDALLLTGLVICIEAFCLLATNKITASLLSTLMCLIFFLSILFWARFLYRYTVNLAVLCLALGVLQVCPLIVGGVMRDQRGEMLPFATPLMQISILSSLPAVWSNHSNDLYASTIPIQIALMFLPAGLLFWDYRRRSNLLLPAA